MQVVGFVILVGVIGGVAVSTQAALAGLLTSQVGTIHGALIVFGGGLLFAGLLGVLFRGEGLGGWRDLPGYVFLAGPLGVIIISSIGFTTSRLGVAAALTLIVVVQLVVGALLDHVGWLTLVRPLSLTRLVGMAVLFLGTWLVLK